MKHDKILLNFIENRLAFFVAFNKIIKSRAEYKSMIPIFKKLELDYKRGIVPIAGDEKVYGYFKTPNNFERIITTKLGKYIKKHYKDIVPKDHILSEFIATLNAILWKKPPRVRVYTGKDIITTYNSFKGKRGLDTCMVKDNKPNELLGLYSMNPDVIALHCLEDFESTKARALVWTLENGDKIVDRIYPNSGENFQKFKQYFKQKENYYIRSNHKMSNDGEIITVNKKQNIIVTLKSKNMEYFPYLDTFQFGKCEGDKLILSNTRLTDFIMQFDDQDGGYNNSF